jgi:nicotinamide-nucleotide amidase
MIEREMNVRREFEALTKYMISQRITVTTMESCTSGLIASLFTDTEGASAILHGAFVTYSNEAKIRMGVDADLIARYGVYSRETAHNMAQVCRQSYAADIGIGITGTFGNPDPANPDFETGKVFFCLETPTETVQREFTIPRQPTRYAYKLYTAAEVAKELKGVLHL